MYSFIVQFWEFIEHYAEPVNKTSFSPQTQEGLLKYDDYSLVISSQLFKKLLFQVYVKIEI